MIKIAAFAATLTCSIASSAIAQPKATPTTGEVAATITTFWVTTKTLAAKDRKIYARYSVDKTATTFLHQMSFVCRKERGRFAYLNIFLRDMIAMGRCLQAGRTRNQHRRALQGRYPKRFHVAWPHSSNRAVLRSHACDLGGARQGPQGDHDPAHHWRADNNGDLPHQSRVRPAHARDTVRNREPDWLFHDRRHAR